MAELPFQESQLPPNSRAGNPEWAGLARFVALYFSLQFLTALASLLLRGVGFFRPDSALEPVSDADIQGRILPGILAQILSFLPGLVLIGITVGKEAFVLGKLGNPLRLGIEFLVVSFGCHMVQQAALWIHYNLWDFVPQPHPFSKLGQSTDAPWIWIVLGFAACVVAPINEEIIYRRLPGMWLTGSFGKNSLFFLAGVFASLGASQNKTSPWQEQILPLIWVGGLFLLTKAGALRGETQWLVASACLFSAIHSFAWPTPIPLFFFGVYQVLLLRRTGGLMAPILFHAWFNLLGVFGLLWDVFGP